MRRVQVRLLDAAHQQPGGPIVLVWDNLTARKDALMRSLIAARPWLTVFYLPACAPLTVADGPGDPGDLVVNMVLRIAVAAGALQP